MSGKGYAVVILRKILVDKHASPFFHSVPGWDVAAMAKTNNLEVLRDLSSLLIRDSFHLKI
jgi:hypothetical protein